MTLVLLPPNAFLLRLCLVRLYSDLCSHFDFIKHKSVTEITEINSEL